MIPLEYSQPAASLRVIIRIFAAKPKAHSDGAGQGGLENEMAYVIAEPCIGTKDTACVDACPVDCIHPKSDEDDFENEEMLYIDPDECIDCGACVPVCPVSAIFALEDLPEKWADFEERNTAHYQK